MANSADCMNFVLPGCTSCNKVVSNIRLVTPDAVWLKAEVAVPFSYIKKLCVIASCAATLPIAPLIAFLFRNWVRITVCKVVRQVFQLAEVCSNLNRVAGYIVLRGGDYGVRVALKHRIRECRCPCDVSAYQLGFSKLSRHIRLYCLRSLLRLLPLRRLIHSRKSRLCRISVEL